MYQTFYKDICYLVLIAFQPTLHDFAFHSISHLQPQGFRRVLDLPCSSTTMRMGLDGTVAIWGTKINPRIAP